MSRGAEPQGATGRRLVRAKPTWLAYLSLGLFAYLETSIGPAMPFLRSALDLDYTMASLHFAAFAAGGFLFGLAGERVGRRWGRQWALWGGLAGMAAGAALLAVSPSVVGTIAGVFAMGWLGTLALVTNQATLADLHGEQRAVAFAESNVAASAAAIGAPLAIGALAAAGLGWRAGLLVGLPLLAVLWWFFRTVRLPAAARTEGHRGERARLPRAYWFFWAVLFLAASVEWSMAYWGADFLASVVGLGPALAASAMSVFFAAMVGGRLAGARLARRYDGTRLLLAALAVAAVGFPLCWLALSPALSIVGLFVAGAGIANFYPLTLAAATDAAPGQTDRAMARLAVSGSGALLVAPLLVGGLADAVGMRWGFGVVMALILAATVAVLAARRAQRGSGALVANEAAAGS